MSWLGVAPEAIERRGGLSGTCRADRSEKRILLPAVAARVAARKRRGMRGHIFVTLIGVHRPSKGGVKAWHRCRAKNGGATAARVIIQRNRGRG